MNRYPLWRYILLLVIIVLGMIYASPMLYGEDYAVQIAAKNSQKLSTSLSDNIAEILQQQNIPVKSIALKTGFYLVRLTDESYQAKAQNILEAGLTQYGDYSVALNLAPRTPEWLQALGATPMKLGLDLRGGIHFLLEVKVDQMVKETIKSDMRAMTDKLRDERIRYSGIRLANNNTISVSFKSAEARDQALSLFKGQFDSATFAFDTSDSKSSYYLTATMPQDAIVKLQQSAITQNINVLRTRVDALGISQPIINQQGKNQISVDLPGVQDMAQAKSLIGAMATIRLQLNVKSTGWQDGLAKAQEAQKTGVVPFGLTLYDYNGQPVLVQNQVILQGSDILSATSTVDENGRPAVSLRVGGNSVSAFNRITGENIGQYLAVIYTTRTTEKSLVDGKVMSKSVTKESVINNAVINGALGNQFIIQGLSSPQYASDLALQLRSGAYVAPVEFVQEKSVGPTLGKQNIRHGALSCAVGSLVVIIFMAFYYGLFGLISNLALILNIILVVALMSVLGATLTLPGIAGIVLTVGMAVDANVLINERIREELRNGVTPQASIHAGYARAFSTIVDANVTTLIVAMVMYALGTSDVKGLAVTLILGLMTSMLTAIFFTRAIVNLIYGRSQVKSLSIGIKVK